MKISISLANIAAKQNENGENLVQQMTVNFTWLPKIMWMILLSRSKKHFKEKLSTCNTRDVYRIINSLLNKNVHHLPFYESACNLSNKFANYFLTKIVKIREDLDAELVIPNSQFTDSANTFTVPPLSTLRPTTEDEVLRLISKSPSKSSRLDPIPTWFLKENISQLLPVLTHIINSSLSSGIFPSGAHSAIIKPLLKKKTLDKNVLKNYRPVSNITVLGKLIEKIACARLTEHMDHYNLADSHQSAYRAAHSTESALIKVKNDIMLSIDCKKAMLLVLLDLSAAFDTIDHKILVSRLSKRIGVSGTALDWFQSYLEGWTSRVEIAGNLSKPITANFGLPQGSVVGPIGYSIYTLPVGDIARDHGVNYHVYADDTQLYVSFDPSDPLELENGLTVLQNCIKDIRIWMSVNKLKLNESKLNSLLLLLLTMKNAFLKSLWQ